MKLTKKQEAYLAVVASDLRVFLQQAFISVYPNKQYMDNWHIAVSYTHLDVYKRQNLE